MEYLPFILYIAAIIFVIYTQIQSNKDLKMVGGVLGGIGMLIILGMMIFDFGSKGIKKGAEYLDDRGAKKERCAERAEDASNSYAAKKIYKACMSR